LKFEGFRLVSGSILWFLLFNVGARLFGEHYVAMRDDDLQRLSFDVGNLVPKAREALRSEMDRRHFPIAEVDWNAQPAQPPPPPAAAKTKKSDGVIVRNVVIFLVSNIVFFGVIATLLSLVKGVDMEKLGEGMTKFVLYNTLALTLIAPKFIVPRKLKTVWIIGIVEPVCVALLFGVFSLFR
jgi:hypothetical protein